MYVYTTYMIHTYSAYAVVHGEGGADFTRAHPYTYTPIHTYMTLNYTYTSYIPIHLYTYTYLYTSIPIHTYMTLNYTYTSYTYTPIYLYIRI